MNTKYTVVYALISSLLLFSCGEKEESKAEQAPPIPVQVSKVSESTGAPFLSASGKVEATRSADISTRMMGYVDRIPVQVGESVKQGQLLLSINNADLSAKLAQVEAGITEARAAFANAEKDYNRFTALFSENSASQKELDDMTARYNMARARLEAASQMKKEVNAQLSYANIRAPFSGVVTNRFINPGDMANPGMPLLEIEAPGKFQVLAMVPESEISSVKTDTEVGVLLKSIAQEIKGKVTEVSTSSKNTGGQYLVKVVLEPTEAGILSGMYATVQFPLARQAAAEAVMIPVSALVENGELRGVYTVSQSQTALLRWLRLGRTSGDQVEVLSGLSAEEEYIVSAESKLYNGARISIQ